VRIWSFVGGRDVGSRAGSSSKRRRLVVVRQRVVPDVSGRAWPLVCDVGDWVGGGRPLSVILRRWWSRMVSGGWYALRR